MEWRIFFSFKPRLLIRVLHFLLFFNFTEDICRSSQDKKTCTKLQSVGQQLKELQEEHQQTMADMRLLVTSMARLQKKVKQLESVSGLSVLINPRVKKRQGRINRQYYRGNDTYTVLQVLTLQWTARLLRIFAKCRHWRQVFRQQIFLARSFLLELDCQRWLRAAKRPKSGSPKQLLEVDYLITF